MEELLSQSEAEDIVTTYLANQGTPVSTQEILDSRAIPALQGFHVQPGKVSDSVFGGAFSYKNKETNEMVQGENPGLYTPSGIPFRLMVRTERLSAFDEVQGVVPFKDQILAVNHHVMRELLRDLIGTSQYDIPNQSDNSVVIAAENLEQIGYENVLRSHMAKSSTSTSLYLHYMRGERDFCGHTFPDGLVQNGPLGGVYATPSTKSDDGDVSVPPEYLFENGICTPTQFIQITQSSIKAYQRVQQWMSDRGLVLADTKTEHGVNRRGIIVSQDELFTLDSSRYWDLNEYESQARLLSENNIKQIELESYSKQFGRDIIAARGPYDSTEDLMGRIAVRYILSLQKITQKRFEPDMRSSEERVISGLETVVDQLGLSA